ncbi:MAG: hypothetical protein QNJ00_12170 [Woeseiaceae bacterium]|nr:hypothetical protein [Woeseiaceae bacterium]
MSNGTKKARRAIFGAKWLVLLALVTSQFALAAHQFEHAADDVDEACGVCLNLDSRDDVLTSPAQPVGAPAIAFLPRVDVATVSPAVRFSRYNARASP